MSTATRRREWEPRFVHLDGRGDVAHGGLPSREDAFVKVHVIQRLRVVRGWEGAAHKTHEPSG